MRNWFSIRAAVDPTRAQLHLFGEIGPSYWGEPTVTAAAFIEQLAALPADVRSIEVHVNSVGGDIAEAVAIANALRAQHTTHRRTVDVVIDGLAASAASVVIMGGQRILMPENALVYLHRPWTMTVGNAADHRAAADTLDVFQKTTIMATYRWHSALPDAQLVALLDGPDGEGTWLDQAAALAAGFATEAVACSASEPIAAALQPSTLARLDRVAAQYRPRVAALLNPRPRVPAAAVDVLRLCTAGNCLALAEGLIADGATLEDVQARVTEATTARTQAERRGHQIRALCRVAGAARLAPVFERSTLPLEDIQAALTEISALADGAPGELDATLPVPGARRQATGGTTAEIYAARQQARKAAAAAAAAIV